MAVEQGLYAQVVKIRRKDLKFIAANKNKNEAKFKFQGLSARSQRWFDLVYRHGFVFFFNRNQSYMCQNLLQSNQSQDQTKAVIL